VAGQWFSPGTSVSSTNKTDRHDIKINIVESGIKHHKPNPEKEFVVVIIILMKA
jgi:hypothetical protein